MHKKNSIFFYGFAIFAMFFGSGNLVFPLSIGYYSGHWWLFGFLGLLLTGILLPFLGLWVIKLYKGDYENFFHGAGRLAGVSIPFFTLSLLGAFGVIPRCITVAYGGASYIFPELSLFIFASFFCILTYIFCLKDKFMVDVLGKWMSPILLVALFVLIGVGVIKNPASILETNGKEAFLKGFLTGYQTMDLFAAFFFSALLFKQIQDLMAEKSGDRQVLLFSLKSSVIGALLLSIVYLGFVYLGSHYSFLIKDVSPEYMLPTIAKYVMGDSVTVFLAMTMLFSCLTTAIALNNIYARYLCTLCRLNESKFPLILSLTTGISFIISLLDFKGIAKFLSPALEISYPGVIFLTIMSIFTKGYKKTKTYMFWLITGCSCVYLLLNALNLL